MDQQEQKEWDAVNRLLQHHGFKPVSFADPTENKNLAELVLLERKSAADIRLMFKTMLSDSERRQGLIQELIQSNSQLKEEVQQHQTRAARHSQRAAELEGVLDGVKVKVQDLEDSYIHKASQQHSQFTQLQQEKKDAERRCDSLEQKLSQEEDQVSQLQKKLQYAVREEERRVARQNQAFQQIHRRSIRPNSTTDQQILDVIDVYESQIQQLRSEVKMSKSGSGDALNSQKNRSRVEKDPTDTLSNYKTILKSYQEQLKETKAQREELKNEIQKLKADLESRPTAKELKTCKQQLRRMDRFIQQSNVKSSVKTEDSAETRNTDNTSIQHLDASTCKRYLIDVCSELKIQDVSRLIPDVKDRCKTAESASGLQKILRDITGVLTNQRAPLGLLRQQGEFEVIVSTLAVWSQQLNALNELHRALCILQKRLLPWQPGAGTCISDSIRVEDLMLIVDTLLDETTSDDKVLRSPTRHTLESMVAHFQQLFDVSSLTGIYPRMNELYSKLGEMNNAMRNLRDVLDLDDRAPPSEVVNKVAGIVSQTSNKASNHELYKLLETSDIDSIIIKLKEHEEFFPAFHSFILELLETLDVQNLDNVLPTLRSLKSTV
ncbi:LOW QUALITY PROTEIN: centrosomal protein of 70 kDa [Triplophysa dalaica]|uniref:LOW QUALITY PROTEIN: centrosomal protein of 70 kDa n=1 Tax=Triplophysa dalaica TaxID=1582913 RepID=UPI0024DFF62D|nr:LOW QUALITY PROTEIN: centrosomal protein of 70 kDa [Triplophysa dalaica]